MWCASNTIVILTTLLVGVSLVLSEGFSVARPATTTTWQRPLVSPTFSTPKSTMTSPVAVKAVSLKGGALKASNQSSECPASKPMEVFGALWGSLGVVYILVKSIRRVLPIALEPFAAGTTMALTNFQWSMYGLTCLFFAYAEGYKGFHKKFSPLVVKRSFTLVLGSPQGSFLNYLFAPLYSMGLMHATKKRLITSWAVSLGVAGIVAAVKKLPGVWRCIIDGGVIVGLSVGSISILYYFIKSWATGKAPDVDSCLPETKKD